MRKERKEAAKRLATRITPSAYACHVTLLSKNRSPQGSPQDLLTKSEWRYGEWIIRDAV